MPSLVGWEQTSDAAIPNGKGKGINPTVTKRVINRLAMPEFLPTRPVGRTPDPMINIRRASWLVMLQRRVVIQNTCIIPGG
jgi:hypothetical protein